MTCTRTDNGEMTIIRIDGTLDAPAAAELGALTNALVADKRSDVTLDASGLRLIDSSGVGEIVALFKRVRAHGGRVRIEGLRDQPRAIFRLLRLDRVFPVN